MAEEAIALAEEAVQDSSEQDVSTVEQQPEPATEETTGEGDTGAEPSGETQETQGEGTDDNWLPTEQAKVYPVAVLQEYAAKRFPNLSSDLIAKDPGVQELLKGKLDADIYIRSQQLQDDGTAEEESGEFLDAGLPEPEQEDAQLATDAAQADPRAAHYQRVDQIVSQIDPKVTEELGRNVLSAMQINADPKYIEQLQSTLRNNATPPEQRAAIQQHLDLVNNAGKLGGTLGRAALDLMATALPSLLPDYLEQVYPGSQARYQRGVVADTWSQLSSAVGKDQKPLYPSLPQFGTPQFVALVRKTEKALGLKQYGLDTFNRYDANGAQVPFQDHAKYITRLIAKAASGGAVNPALVNQALQTGKNKREDTAQRRNQGRALGSGQPTSSSGGGSGNDDIFGPGMAEYKRRGG